MKSDSFVFLDNVEYTRSFINRNKIKTPNGWMWLTLPVKKDHRVQSKINQVEIDNSRNWKMEHWKSIQRNYGKAEYFNQFKDFFENIFSKEWTKLSDMNIFIIKKLSKFLGIERKFFEASKLNVSGKGTELLINICKAVGATGYFSGQGSKNYMDDIKFKKQNIKLTYQEIKHPQHKQRFGKFIPNLSFIDILFNEGKENTLKIMKNL